MESARAGSAGREITLAPNCSSTCSYARCCSRAFARSIGTRVMKVSSQFDIMGLTPSVIAVSISREVYTYWKCVALPHEGKRTHSESFQQPQSFRKVKKNYSFYCQ